MKLPEVIIIGAGPGGLAAARALLRSEQVAVTIVQRAGMAAFLPGILPILAGLNSISTYHHPISIPQVRVLAGEVAGLETGRVRLTDGTVLHADAIIAAPGLSTNPATLPAGPRSFPVWELKDAASAQQAVQALSAGRVVISIAALPYRCPPAPYGLAMTLKALFQERRQAVDVVVTTPEERPLQALGERVSAFLESLLHESQITLYTAFQLHSGASRDGLLVAVDGRSIPYDLGLFVPPHQRPTLLAELPGNGPLVQVDPYLRSALEKVWVIGDVAASPLPRAAGVAEAQGQTAAASVLTTLGLSEPQAPTLPAPECYVWTSLRKAARIQIRFPDGLPPSGKPDILLEAPEAALLAEALRAPQRWRQRFFSTG